MKTWYLSSIKLNEDNDTLKENSRADDSADDSIVSARTAKKRSLME